MRLSLNEIEVTARKAALGAGLALGLAEEAGAAAAWLGSAGFPVATLLAAALEAPGEGVLELARTGGAWRLSNANGPCSVLRAFPSACDLVLASARESERIAVEAEIDIPALALAQAGIASRESERPLAVEIGDDLRALMSGGVPRLYGTIAELTALRCQRLRLRVCNGQNPQGREAFGPEDWARARNLAFERGVWVEDEAWERIEALAARMLVPATVRSREHGAGAGLIDAD